jgi:hypothetical protein
MTMFIASRRSKVIIEAYFGDALYVPRNFRARKQWTKGYLDKNALALQGL